MLTINLSEKMSRVKYFGSQDFLITADPVLNRTLSHILLYKDMILCLFSFIPIPFVAAIPSCWWRSL